MFDYHESTSWKRKLALKYSIRKTRHQRHPADNVHDAKIICSVDEYCIMNTASLIQLCDVKFPCFSWCAETYITITCLLSSGWRDKTEMSKGHLTLISSAGSKWVTCVERLTFFLLVVFVSELLDNINFLVHKRSSSEVQEQMCQHLNIINDFIMSSALCSKTHSELINEGSDVES